MPPFPTSHILLLLLCLNVHNNIRPESGRSCRSVDPLATARSIPARLEVVAFPKRARSRLRVDPLFFLKNDPRLVVSSLYTKERCNRRAKGYYFFCYKIDLHLFPCTVGSPHIVGFVFSAAKLMRLSYSYVIANSLCRKSRNGLIKPQRKLSDTWSQLVVVKKEGAVIKGF